MMRRIPLIDGCIYHVFNRGVEKRDIFKDEQDYYRFIHNLYELNNKNPVVNSSYYFEPENVMLEQKSYRRKGPKRELLVDVLVFTLMPNHFHLLLRQRREEGITRFIQKVCIGYTMYFNQKYKREGGLFQGRFKAVYVHKQEHFQYLPFYIHSNPLRLNHRGQSPADWQENLMFLENYRWSSFPDYIGRKNFPSLTHREFILGLFGGEEEYKRHTERCLQEQEQGTWNQVIHEVMLD
jgi:putative transposase